MGDDGDVSRVVDLLGDDYARTILVHARDDPKSVEVLSDECDAAPSTIYRRVERLVEAGLLEVHQQLDPDGHHYKEYAARLDEVSITLEADGFSVEVDHGESPADRFTRLYEGFK